MKVHYMVSIIRHSLRVGLKPRGMAEWGMLRAPGLIPNTRHKRVKTEPRVIAPLIPEFERQKQRDV